MLKAKQRDKDTDYLFLSAMLRAREARMLTADKAQRMIDAPSFDEAVKLAAECDYPDMTGMNAAGVEQALADRRAEVFAELASLCAKKEIVDVFRIKYDYHNAKVLVKAEGAGTDGEHILSSAGRIPLQELREAYLTDTYTCIPDRLAEALTKAKDLLARSGNPQMADFAADRAYFAELLELAEALGSDFLLRYVRLLIDTANLRAAVRTLRMGKDVDFLRLALISGGGVGTERVAAAASSGDTLAQLYTATVLEPAANLAAEAIGGSMTAFEKACDNAVTEFLRGAKIKSFGPEPVIAYIAALESEITSVRMILTGLLAGINRETLRERLRETYA